MLPPGSEGASDAFSGHEEVGSFLRHAEPLTSLQSGERLFSMFRVPMQPAAVADVFARSPGEFRELLARIERWRTDRLLIPTPRPIASSQASQAIRVGVNRDCCQAFLVFSGKDDAAFFGSERFAASADLLRRNVIMLRDLAQRYYTAGISMGISSVPLLLGWMNRHLRTLRHVTKTYCFGSSMGAFAAILYGYELGVDEVIAIAPPHVTYGGVDLRQVLSRASGRTRCRIYFAKDNNRDAAVAKALARDSRVELVQQPGGSHYVLAKMSRAGALESIFPKFEASPHQQRHSREVCGTDAGEAETLEIIKNYFSRWPPGRMVWSADLELDALLDSFEAVEFVTYLQERVGAIASLGPDDALVLGTPRSLARTLVKSRAGTPPCPEQLPETLLDRCRE